jgi:hypothetical protein
VRSVALAAALLAAAAALGIARPAAAEGPPSAVEQYSEEVPTGAGSKPVTDKKAKHPSPELSVGLGNLVRQKGGKDATALLRVAKSKSLGAPVRTPGTPLPSKAALRNARAAVPSAASVVADTAGGSHLPWLVAALLGMAVVALVPLALRARKR